MGLWGTIFAAGYDRFMAATERSGLARFRQELLARAAGRVLEIGAGTGANLSFYGASVTELLVAEPEEPMAHRLEQRIALHRRTARLLRAPAEDLPVPPGSIDYVVSTLVLCTVADPVRALSEVRRVLKPGGEMLFIEHVRSSDPRLARWQARLRVPWSWFGHGCQCDRRTLDSVVTAGFELGEVRDETLSRAPPIVRPLVVGSARRGE